jgi:hypothetical protein
MNVRLSLGFGLFAAICASSSTLGGLALAQKAPDPNQPATTSGGLYTLETFPLKEIERTLTMTEGVFELRPTIETDLSKDRTFEGWTVSLDARYGLRDTLELQAGTDLTLAAPDGFEKPKSFYVAGEIALKYDMVDARLALNLPVDPDFLFDIAIGLPVRIRIGPSIAIVGLEEVIIIHTIKPDGVEDTPKPDLNISLAGIVQVMDQLAIFVRGTVLVREFDTRAQIPVSVSLQYSVSNILDLGLTLVLSDLRFKTPAIEGVESESKPFDQRSAALFARFRFGR